MSCGCKQPANNNSATLAAMCQTCPMAIRDGYGSAVECKHAGLQVLHIAVGGVPCPLGRFDQAGVVRWMGVEWVGVPEPLRWVLTWQLKRVPRNLEGCGCIKAIKQSKIGPWVETWFEGVTLLRNRFGGFLTEFQAIRRGV